MQQLLSLCDLISCFVFFPLWTPLDLTGNCVQAKFLGNAPCGLYKYKFPRALRTEGSVGAKIFFFKALLQSGDLLQAERREDYVWVSKGELGDYLKPDYLTQVNRFLMDQ